MQAFIFLGLEDILWQRVSFFFLADTFCYYYIVMNIL